MKQNNSVEFATGLFIFLGFLAIFFLTTQTSNIKAYTGEPGYRVTARFTNIGNLKVRAPVKMAGVTIGRVKGIDFDGQALDAVVTMEIAAEFDQIPADSNASILTSGLLGDNYIGLEPGADMMYLEDGNDIAFTQSAIVLEHLISKYLFNQASSGEGE